MGWRYWIVGNEATKDEAAGGAPAADAFDDVLYDRRWSGWWSGLPYAVRARVIRGPLRLTLSIASTSAGATTTRSVPLATNAIITLAFDRVATVVATTVDRSPGTNVATLDLEIAIRASFSPTVRIARDQVVVASAAPPP